MTSDQIAEVQRLATAALQRERAIIDVDLTKHNLVHGMNNDRAAIKNAPAHIRADFFSANSYARTKPGDQLTIHYSTQTGTMHTATYTYTETQPNTRAYQWQRQMFPDTLDRALIRSWQNLRWPKTLTNKHLSKLARGWTIEGGFAINPTIAKHHATIQATKRHAELTNQLTNLEQHLKKSL